MARGVTGSIPIDQVGEIINDLPSKIPTSPLDSLTNSADPVMGKMSSITDGIRNSVKKSVSGTSLGNLNGLNITDSQSTTDSTDHVIGGIKAALKNIPKISTDNAGE
jgi:hypothetical protein